MPQEEGKTNYKYEDYASEVAANRLPQSAALVDQKMAITLESGTTFEVEFADQNTIIWQSGDESGTDWCDAASTTHVIDPSPPVGWTTCLNPANAPTTAANYDQNRQGDPGFVGSDAAISEAPWAVFLADPTHLRAQGAVLQGNGTRSFPWIWPLDVDWEGDARSDPTTCDVGHDETP